MGPYKPLRNWVDEFIPYYMEVMGVDRTSGTSEQVNLFHSTKLFKGCRFGPFHQSRQILEKKQYLDPAWYHLYPSVADCFRKCVGDKSATLKLCLKLCGYLPVLPPSTKNHKQKLFWFMSASCII